MSIYDVSVQFKMSIAKKRDPKKWAAAKRKALNKMGGTWSARAAQLAVKYYKDMGGRYVGKKQQSNSLSKWGKQKWRTRDGGKAKQKDGSTKRYLPDKAWKRLTPSQRKATDDKKRKGSKRGEKNTPNTKRARSAGKRAGK